MKTCKHCGGDGTNDLYDDNICAACGGSGEVPDSWSWNSEGNLVMPDEIEDGFRPRRKRPKGWEAKAIKDGSVRDPKLGPNPPETHSPDAVVVDVPALDFNVTGDSNGDR